MGKIIESKTWQEVDRRSSFATADWARDECRSQRGARTAPKLAADHLAGAESITMRRFVLRAASIRLERFAHLAPII